jgi:hypothetical protein
LTETLVEVATAFAAGDVDQNAVEYHALLLVLIEAEIEKLPKVPSALRRAKRIGVPDVAGTRIAVRYAAMARKATKSRAANNPSPITGAPVVL